MKLDVSSLAHTKISYRICAEIQETDHIRKDQTVLHAFPMHLWKRFEAIDRFRAAYPALAARVVRITADGESFEV